MKRVQSLLSSNKMDRRSLLRGMGTAIALPLMEAMLPSTSLAATATPKRLSVMYAPNGVFMKQFTPATVGANYKMTPILEPLSHLRDDFVVISGLGLPSGGGHARGCAGLLTGAQARETEGSDLECGISMDQLIASQYSSETQFPSLQMGIEPSSLLGSCAPAYSCTYTNTLSWRSPTSALPVAVNPAEVFARMFGDGDIRDAKTREAQLRQKTSILDFVREDAQSLSAQMGMQDRRKLDEYLTSIRDVERRIQMSAARAADVDYSSLERPAGIPQGFAEHVHLMIDLQVLALQTDLTRVTTFMLGRELSNRVYPEIGVPDSHHMLSHHADDPKRIEKLVRINAYHKAQYAYFLERLRDTKDGDSTLLDSTFLISGACMGDSNVHDSMDMPIIVAGGGIAGNRHIRVPTDTPVSNMHVTLLQQFGIQTDSFGDSTGALDLFTA